MPLPLADDAQDQLATDRFGQAMRSFEEVGSTNERAHAAARSFVDPTSSKLRIACPKRSVASWSWASSARGRDMERRRRCVEVSYFVLRIFRFVRATQYALRNTKSRWPPNVLQRRAPFRNPPLALRTRSRPTPCGTGAVCGTARRRRRESGSGAASTFHREPGGGES